VAGATRGGADPVTRCRLAEGGPGLLQPLAARGAGLGVEAPGTVVGPEQKKLLVHGFKDDSGVRQQESEPFRNRNTFETSNR
jgi:hypothetical protein